MVGIFCGKDSSCLKILGWDKNICKGNPIGLGKRIQLFIIVNVYNYIYHKDVKKPMIYGIL
jgi:hypothetical protein